MRRLLQIAALTFTAAAVVATSPVEPSFQSATFTFDVQTRDRAVYALRLVNPPEGGSATLQVDLTSSSVDSAGDRTPVFIALGDRMPLASEVDWTRATTADQAGPLGRVLLNGKAPVRLGNLSFEQGESRHYLTLLRGDAGLAVLATFRWDGEPYPGDLVIEDVTQELK